MERYLYKLHRARLCSLIQIPDDIEGIFETNFGKPWLQAWCEETSADTQHMVQIEMQVVILT